LATLFQGNFKIVIDEHKSENTLPKIKILLLLGKTNQKKKL
jgi:hypothetical protein